MLRNFLLGFLAFTPLALAQNGPSFDCAAAASTISGARYDADFGQFIWIKSDEAHYRGADTDRQDFSCKRVK